MTAPPRRSLSQIRMLTRDLAGLAGAPRQPLGPPITRPHSYIQGPFGAILRPSLAAQLAGGFPDEMVLDFLTARPDLDGNGGTRLVQAHHAPQSIRLQSFSQGEWAVPHEVRFVALGPADRLMLGLYDGAGILMAWGAPLEHSKGPRPPHELVFPSHHIRVKRVRR